MPITTVGQNCIISNKFIQKTLEISDGRLAGSAVTNARTGETVIGGRGSQEFAVTFISGGSEKKIEAGELKIKNISSKEENGVNFTAVEFEPISVFEDKIALTLVFEAEENKHYIKKYLKFSLDSGEGKAVLDSIDFEPLRVPRGVKSWHIPKQTRVHISGFATALGQPVFVSSLFAGFEFPVCYSTIKKRFVTVKFFSGKTVAELTKENGEYVTYKSVLGAADKASRERLMAAFFEYIKDISRPAALRRQYNSWYDHMLDINDENISRSFLEIEKSMTAAGTKPLDCYVVDDGWNDYTKDFWCFNDKFPNELYPASKLAEAFGSKFGLWIGPRGGYTDDTPKFAKHIENGGNGYYNAKAKDICVASKKYIDKTADLMSDYQKRFKLTYWKLDGFAFEPCSDKAHDHITGGFGNMYFYTEMWERWLGVFERLTAEAENGVFLNLTSYAFPSPWFLQWVDSLYIQISGDMGMTGSAKKTSEKDRLLNYRDNCYYSYYRKRQFCFPASNIYNHDPIYGNEAHVSMSDGEFRSYLFSMAVRGTSFWELYYSYNMMNESKWRTNNAVLLFVEENFRMLRNSLPFGGKPASGKVYGFGCFNGNEAIVSLRNPSSKKKNYTLCLDNGVGADERFKNAAVHRILPYSDAGADGTYSFGDKMQVELAPYETKIFHFGKKPQALEAVYVKAKSGNTLEITFNQTVCVKDFACESNRVKSVRLLDDFRSVLAEFENDFTDGESLVIRGARDVLLNESEITVKVALFSDDRVLGDGDFAITAELKKAGGDEVLFSQKDEIELAVKNGKAVFTVAGDSIVSRTDAENAEKLCAVRERNGVIKLYADKKLDCGKYTGNNAYLKGNESDFDKNRVRLIARALSFDEV